MGINNVHKAHFPKFAEFTHVFVQISRIKPLKILRDAAQFVGPNLQQNLEQKEKRVML